MDQVPLDPGPEVAWLHRGGCDCAYLRLRKHIYIGETRERCSKMQVARLFWIFWVSYFPRMLTTVDFSIMLEHALWPIFWLRRCVGFPPRLVCPMGHRTASPNFGLFERWLGCWPKPAAGWGRAGCCPKVGQLLGRSWETIATWLMVWRSSAHPNGGIFLGLSRCCHGLG